MHSVPGRYFIDPFHKKVQSSVLWSFQLRMRVMWMQIPAKVTGLFDVSVRRVWSEPVTPSRLKNKLT